MLSRANICQPGGGVVQNGWSNFSLGFLVFNIHEAAIFHLLCSTPV